eukprot:1143607-Pleurochrysis_carterae.AAC.2
MSRAYVFSHCGRIRTGSGAVNTDRGFACQQAAFGMLMRCIDDDYGPQSKLTWNESFDCESGALSCFSVIDWDNFDTDPVLIVALLAVVRPSRRAFELDRDLSII